MYYFLLFVLLFIFIEFFLRIEKQKKTHTYYKKIIKDSIKIDENKIKDFLLNNSKITRVVQTPIIGWKCIPNFKTNCFKIDNHGFRNSDKYNENFLTEKEENYEKKNTIKIAIFGGSVAMSSFASSNTKTISEELKKILQKKFKKKIIVYNFAMTSFTLVQEVALFNLIKHQFNQDINIFIDGHNDITSSLNNEKFFFDYINPHHNNIKVSNLLLSNNILIDLLKLLSLKFITIRYIKNIFAKSNLPKIKNLKINDKKIVNSFFNNYKNIENNSFRSSNQNKIKNIFILQPSLFMTTILNNNEIKFKNKFDQNYVDQYTAKYNLLIEDIFKKNQILESDLDSNKDNFYFNFSDANKLKENILVDDCHLNDDGYAIFASKIGIILEKILEKK